MKQFSSKFVPDSIIIILHDIRTNITPVWTAQVYITVITY